MIEQQNGRIINITSVIGIIGREGQSNYAALYVPDKPGFEIDGKDKVFLYKKGELNPITFETGMKNEDFIEIINGFKKGDIVVSESNNNLKEGIRTKKKKINY